MVNWSSLRGHLLLLIGVISASVQAAAGDVDAPPDRRLALVIGNSAYKSSPLVNPVNDARAVGRMLAGLGFDVMQHENLTQRDFVQAIREFGSKLRETKATGLFYYAGHGMQVKGSNYLIPVDATIEGEDEIKYMTIDTGQILDKMDQASNKLNIVILDACRDNPFARSFRSKQSGLAQMEAPSGMLIAFATSPGSVAFDGDGVNGVYTKHLLRNLALEGVPIELMLKRVREGVAKETGQKQIPWESSSLFGDFFFKSSPAIADGGRGKVGSTAIELAFWDSVKNSGSQVEMRAYLDQYPAGQFAVLARARLAALAGEVGAVDKGSGRPIADTIALAEPSSTSRARSAVQTKVGDSWTYAVMEGGRKQIDLLSVTISAVDGNRIEETLTRDNAAAFKAMRSFAAGFNLDNEMQEIEMPGKLLMVDFAPYVAPNALPKVGGEWRIRDAIVSMKGKAGKVKTNFTIYAKTEEKIKVPAGTFKAIRVEARGVTAGNSSSSPDFLIDYWYSADVRRVVKIHWRQLAANNQTVAEDVYELYGYHQSR